MVRFGMRHIRLNVARMNGVRGFRLTGEVDLSTIDALTEVMEPELAHGGDITLDMADVSFMDSTGLQVLINCAFALSGKGRIILRSPGNLVRSILALAIQTDKLPNLVVEDGA
jgi:anti-anti-sigma factor